MTLPFILICACLLSAVLTIWTRRYALRRQMLDHPDERRSHTQPTPRGGGISIAAALLISLIVAAFSTPVWQFPALLSAIGLTLVAGIGWWDDHQHIPVHWRLLVHAIAALLLGAALIWAGGGWLLAIVTCASALVLINIWNFMDGIDGIATSQALIAAVGYALLDAPGAVFGWILAASLAGFLPFNVPKARIFLGDAGSGSIGYALALLLALNLLHPPPRPAFLVLPLSVFLVDASLTLLKRMLRGERWWQAHVQHAYQRWARGIGHHFPVTVAYTLAGALSVTLMLREAPFKWLIMLAWWIGLGVAWWRLQHRYGKQ